MCDVIRCDLNCFVFVLFVFVVLTLQMLWLRTSAKRAWSLSSCRYRRIDGFKHDWCEWSLVSGRVLIKAHRSAASTWPAASMTFAPGLSDFSDEWEILDDFGLCSRKLGVRIGIQKKNSDLLKHRFWIQHIQLTCELTLVVHSKSEKLPRDGSNRSMTCWARLQSGLLWEPRGKRLFSQCLKF